MGFVWHSGIASQTKAKPRNSRGVLVPGTKPRPNPETSFGRQIGAANWCCRELIPRGSGLRAPDWLQTNTHEPTPNPTPKPRPNPQIVTRTRGTRRYLSRGYNANVKKGLHRGLPLAMLVFDNHMYYYGYVFSLLCFRSISLPLYVCVCLSLSLSHLLYLSSPSAHFSDARFFIRST